MGSDITASLRIAEQRKALESARVRRSAGERQLLSRMPADSKASSIALAMRLGTGSRTAKMVEVSRG